MDQSMMSSGLLWTLVAAQIALGGFDVVFHHELTERLSWKKSAASELKLHAARNLFYAGLFLVLAWCRPAGWLAVALIGVLFAEIIITLIDFVEEDRSRKLPATERVLHTVLAINYGAILALIVPEILRWTGEPTGFVAQSYGIGSAVLTIAGLGVALFGLRDVASSRRARGFIDLPPPDVRAFLPGRKSFLITGATGLVGTRLVEALVTAGHDVTVLTRHAMRAGHLKTPVRMIGDLEQIRSSERIDVIVDLAGKSVAGGLWTRCRIFDIIASRVRMTRRVTALVARLDIKPEVLICASAIGFYGVRGDEVLTESDGLGSRHDLTARVCAAREHQLANLERFGVRTVALRIGLVFDRDGGMLAKMLPAFDLCLGGRIGTGQQWLSWIGLDDLVRLTVFAAGRADLRGPVNATAPIPVRNADFATALAKALNRVAVLPVPALPLRLALGGFARELLLGGQRVLPSKAIAAGFVFESPALEPLLRQIAGCPNRSGEVQSPALLDQPRAHVHSVAVPGGG